MWFIYLLKSQKDRRTYIGYAGDVQVRLRQHNDGRVKATKNRRPFEHISVLDRCNTKMEAKQKEIYWKSGAGRRKLKLYFNSRFPPIQ